MRIKIHLTPKKKIFTIPINYNYPLSSAIYRLFFESSPKFSKWLHERGFISSDGKKMKLFTFSRLFISRPKVEGNLLSGSGEVWFYFGTPLERVILENFVVGILKRGKIVIANREVKTEFSISLVEVANEPDFKQEMNYIMLSPTVASTMVEENGKLKEHFLRVDDEGVEENLAKNLIRKYEIVHKRSYEGEIKVELDREYIGLKGGGEEVSKLITIAEGQEKETKVKAFVCPVKILGNPEIQKIAYDCGLGRKNSMGFGMLEVVKQDLKEHIV